MTATSEYMAGRKKWSRPQAMVWCDEPPSLDVNGKFIPVGYEIGSNPADLSEEDLEQSFLILSDHNRAEISMSNERIEQRQRMANGTMRSFFIADKITIDTSWSMLPSRSFKNYPNFDNKNTSSVPNVDTSGKPSLITSRLIDHDKDSETPLQPRIIPAYGSLYEADQQYTADGGAGGGEMLDWYENHTGPFWVLLSYDKYANFDKDTDGTDNGARQKLAQYSDARQMYISNFNYSIVKRGKNNFDMWNVSVTLEEV
jgi:hypothetical protein